ncbi:MAG: DUF4976 domain-containing protein [Cytophagales bacterium]|nr:MAG: DUF4976 domain-containing protein [Cytophagales bacterium]
MKYLLFLLLLSLTAAHAQQRQPNIVFILADDLAQADLGCYGNPYNNTPNLDRLAKSGIRFTQAYASSPVCSPSRSGIMTGKYPARTKLTNFLGGERTDSTSPVNPANWTRFLPAREQTIAERLKPLGYQTGMVGKWHLGGGGPSHGDSLAPWGQGFDYTRVIGKNGLDYYNYSIYEDSYKKEFFDKGTTYLTDKLTDYAVDFLQKRDPTKPFFLYLCYSAPHVFIVPRGDKVGKYLNKYEKFGGKYNPYYGAMLESLDDGVGRVMKQLDDLGLSDNTIIIFTADNGGLGIPELGPIPTTAGNLRKWKGFTYEGGTRVPALLAWKGQVAPNQVSNAYFINTDYAPTFMDLTGLKPDPALDGRSLTPLLRNPQATFERGPIYWHYPHFSNQTSRPSGAMREGNWKLVKSYETNKIELFDLGNDESESRDLSQLQPDRATRMHQTFTTWLKSVDANMPILKK